jgi:hypothetical protein
MKKYLIIIIGLFLLLPFKVNAQTYTYNVCSDESCTYKDLTTVFDEIATNIASDNTYIINVGKGTFALNGEYQNSLADSKNINIEINGLGKDSSFISTYNFACIDKINNLSIKNVTFKYSTDGFTATPVQSQFFVFGFAYIDNFTLSNVDFVDFTNLIYSADIFIYLYCCHNVNISNINVNLLDVFEVFGFDTEYDSVSEAYAGLNATIDYVNAVGGQFAVYSYIYSPNDLRPLNSNIKITNSSLLTAGRSVYIYKDYNYDANSSNPRKNSANLGLQKMADFSPVTVSKTNFDYVTISNSKLTNLEAKSDFYSDEGYVFTGKELYNDITPVIYADYSNTWIREPVKGNNLVEVGNGKIYVDSVTKKDVSVAVSGGTNLADIIPSSDLSNITYEVEDETVARIVDNKVMGLKTGTTKVIARSGLTVYQFSINVISNPTTNTFFMVFVMLFVLLVLATVVTYTLRIENKLND